MLACLGIAADSASPNSSRARELILTADKVVMYGEMEKIDVGKVTIDKDWIGRFANRLAQIPLTRTDQVLGIGYMTAHFLKNNEEVLSVAPISPRYLRIYSKKGGGDFVVDEDDYKQVRALISEKTKTNQSPDPALASGTPPAGQESRHP